MPLESQREVREALPRLLPRLWRFALALSRSRDLADDLVQATCLRALEKSHQFQVGSRVDRWVFSILASIWSNERSKTKIRLGKGHVDAYENLVSNLHESMEINVTARQILNHVLQLPDEQRVVALLIYVEGLTYHEVASTLDLPVGTLLSRMSTVRATLAKRLALIPARLDASGRQS